MNVEQVRRFCESAFDSLAAPQTDDRAAIVGAYADGLNDGMREALIQVVAFIDRGGDLCDADRPRDGYAPRPNTARDAVCLLRRVADARSQYLESCPKEPPARFPMSEAVEMSIQMFRAAADVIESGAVWPWVPTWTNPQFRG